LFCVIHHQDLESQSRWNSVSSVGFLGTLFMVPWWNCCVSKLGFFGNSFHGPTMTLSYF
jgi:hypothetical protein